MKTGPHVTEEEINRFMDFEALLRREEQTVIRRRKLNRLRNVFIGMIALALIPAIFLVQEHSQRNPQAPSEESSPSSAGTVDSIRPQAVDPDSNIPAPSQPVEPAIVPSSKSEEAEKPVAKAQEHTLPEKDEQADAAAGYVQPEPVDGYEALYAYFDKALRYPSVARKDSVEGIVTVTFVIDVQGKVKNVTIENSLGDAFDQEVSRLIDHMPSWRPATFDGTPVESKVSLPITFSVHNEQ
ncbi:MAG TPA: TonB family protein [Chryseosolibacter sp.]|nr:TonB family protein [Chryseosolibacter sp.]